MRCTSVWVSDRIARRTSTPNINAVIANVATEVKGDTTASGSFTVNTVAVKIHSLQTYDSFNTVAAEKGSSILVVYLDQVSTINVTKVSAGIAAQTSVTISGKSYPVRQYKIAGTQIGNDRGWLSFMIPAGSASASLVVGSGASVANIPLTLKK